MPVAPETVLSVALVAVYLLDCAHFLSIWEAVVTTRGGIPHDLSFGSGFELGRRRPYLSNPFTPFRPDFRLEWCTSGVPVRAVSQVAAEMREQLEALRPIGWLASGCGVFIVIIAPLALAFGYQTLFLAAAAACFLGAFGASIVLVLRRARVGLSTGQAVSLIFVALICLPCAPNLARAAAQQRRRRLAASDLPKLGFAPGRLQTLQRRIHDALTRMRAFIPADDRRCKDIDEEIEFLKGRRA